MIRIGFDAKRAFFNTSGLGNYSRFILGALHQAYPENQYLLFSPKKPDLLRFPDFAPVVENMQVQTPSGLLRPLPALWRTFGTAAALRKLQASIYHGLSNELPVGIKGSECKAVVTIHDLIFLRYPNLYKPVDRAIYNFKFRAACASADRIIAISEQTKEDLIHFYKIPQERIEVIYQDCSPLFHHPQSQAMLAAVREKYRLPDRYILAVGTQEERKNQLTLLRAWYNSGLWREAALVLVGKQTKYTLQLQQFAAAHKVSDRVHFMRYIPSEELPAMYQLASVFVYPSTFEGFGIPILEGLNSGVPVITSTGSCFQEAGGTAALYVPPQDEWALAEALQSVWRDTSLRTRMVETGKVHALQFRPERTMPQLMALYQNLLR